MSRMSEMEATIRELRGIASSINDIANWLTGAFSGSEEAAPAPEPETAPRPGFQIVWWFPLLPL